MEPARIAPAPKPASAPQPTPDKAAADPKAQAGPQSGGSFAALLLALDATQATATPIASQDAAGGTPSDGGLAADDGATAAVTALADPATLAAWQGVLSGQQVQGMAQGAAGGAAGGAAKEGLQAAVGRSMAFDAPATATPIASQDAAGGTPSDGGLAADDGATAAVTALADPATLAAWQGVLSGQQVQGMAQGAAGGTAGDAAKEGLQAAVSRSMAFDAPAAIAQPLGLVAQTARLDRAADATDLQGFQAQQGPQAALALRRTLARSAAQAQAGLVDGAAAQAAAAPGATPAHGGHTGADALAAAGAQAAQTDAANASTRGGADAAPRNDPASAAVQATPATAQAAARDALIAAATAASTGAAGEGLRAKGRAADVGAAAPAVPAAGAGTFAATLQPAVGSADASAVRADPALAGAEDRLAQQISYWVHQTTQNAEMTVDQGGAAVQVSVSLTGNEARVHFMTDQAQARALLDANMAQLRELLQGQGLVLTGTSVGTTAQGQGQAAGGQAQEPPAPGRSGRTQGLVVAAPAGTGAGLRALDVFA